MIVPVAMALFYVVGSSWAPAATLDCRPSTIPQPPLSLAYAGPDSKSKSANTLVILRSFSRARRDAWPWKDILSVDLVPASGTVESNDRPTIEAYSAVSGHVSRQDPDSSYAVFSFSAHPLGGNFRVVVNESDSAVLDGCPKNTFHFVIGGFSEP